MADEETIKLRDYQLELYHEIEKRKNCILFLPAGSGKTHIAFWLIRAMARDLKKPVYEGGKRTFFLGNTVQLVEQQAAVLSRMGNFEVLCLTGDSGVDNFDKTKWQSLEHDNEVFVMTTQVYLNALSYAFLRIEDANLLIFDECHHATGNHSMAQVLNYVQKCSVVKRPKILGLSATLLNANVKKEKSNDFTQKLKELEAVFDAEIITSKNCREIRESHSAKPNEIFKTYDRYVVSSITMSTLENICESGTSVLKAVKLKDNITLTAAEEQEAIQLHKPGSNRSKLLRGVISDIVVHVKEYGLYIGYTCCQCYIIELYRYMFVSSEPNYVNMMLYTVNLAQMMRKVLYTSILECSGRGKDDFDTVETITATSGGKLEYVCNRLRSIKSGDKCIIFVQRKLTAKSLYKIVKIFIRQHPDCEVKVDFIIGGVGNPLRNTREGFHHKKQTKHILDWRGEINVLIATDVLEEGIDIQECNTVIMFDPIKTFRSYIQSKGRARMKGSEYVILNDLSAQSVRTQIHDFNDIDRQLDNVLDQKNITLEDDDGDDTTGTIFDSYQSELKSEVTNISAVPRIYMYCNTLPRDLFTDLVPYWFFNRSTKKCTLKLPSNAGINIDIVGAARPNRKEAKQSAALEGVRLLHKLHHLDEHLLPIRVPEELVDTDYWFPNWDLEDDVKLKANAEASDNTITTDMRVPKYLRNCRSLPRSKCYLHIMRTKTEYPAPTIQRQIFCHELMQFDDYKFGFLTREPLPSICEFPVYSDLGEVSVTIEVNAACLELSEQELLYVSQFHRTLFLDVLRVVPKCFMYDTDGESNGYFVVPLKPSRTAGTVEISWKCVKKRFEVDVTRPSEEEIQRQDYSAENYIAKVVAPWYQPNARYIVVDFSDELHLNSEFNARYATYQDYFHQKYGLTALRPAQHLLQVRRLTTNLDGIVPRPTSSTEKNLRKNKKVMEIHLPPEFCHVFSFPSVYWYKATILPSVLHRVHHLLLAEELRERIVAEAGVGAAELPRGDEDTVQSFKKPVAKRVEGEEAQSSNGPRSRKKIKVRSEEAQLRRNKKTDGEMKLKDLDRDSDVSLKEIQQFVQYIETPLASTSIVKSSVIKAGSAIVGSREVTINFVAGPRLMTLNEPSVRCGPGAHQILEVITLQGSGDAFSLERLETLGDSLLKYMVSVATFVKCTRMNEGHLTKLKGQLVSNQNLFYCGKKLDLGSYVKGVYFSTKTSWCPPGFTIPPVLKEQFTGDPLSSLLAATVPYHEKFSGYINVATIERMLKTDVAEYIKKLEKKDEAEEKRINFYLGKQELRRKNVSDVVEALLGVYLKTCGMSGAFKLLKYFGVLSNENWEALLRDVPQPAAPSSLTSLEQLLPEYRRIEKLCNYQFKNKSYLLHAFTHPSFTGLGITDCYQKLEFIGDAVLDFLITSYIFEYCGDLTAGQLTDLRSSLVNNNTFGALAVRLQLHKHLLLHSRRLLEAVDTFVAYQQSKNYEIHGNELMTLINENDTIVAEEVDVPKALGDVFESLAGALFLDSGCDLTVVWNVFYSIMQDELEKFSKKIPINPLRALYERVQSIPGGKMIFSEIESKKSAGLEQLASRKKVLLRIVKSKETYEYHGKGDSLKTAKRAAAKFALRELNCNDFVI